MESRSEAGWQIRDTGKGSEVTLKLWASDLVEKIPLNEGLIVRLGEANPVLFDALDAAGWTELAYDVGTDGTVLSATSAVANNAEFFRLRANIFAKTCTPILYGRGSTLLEQQGSGNGTVKTWQYATAAEGSGACLETFTSLFRRLFSTSWSAYYEPFFSNARLLLTSPLVSASLRASMRSVASPDEATMRFNLSAELQVTAVLLPSLQPRHAQALAELALGEDEEAAAAKAAEVVVERRLHLDSSALVFNVLLTLHNPSNETAALRIFEPTHPFYAIRLHTYSFSSSSSSLSSHQMHGRGLVCDLPSFRALGGAFAWEVQLEPRQRLEARYSADVLLAHRERQPPDASRGVELARVLVRRLDSGRLLRVSPARLLLSTPFPDQTMPYNVLTLYSTLLAFVLGSVINIVSRTKRPAEPTT